MDYYADPRAFKETEKMLEKVGKELSDLKKRYHAIADLKSMGEIDDWIIEARNLKKVQQYDETVMAMIAANETLSAAWDTFRVLYQIAANEELLVTAQEKLTGKSKGVCYGCKREL
jgi:hypothetical protein